jgi:hypothetical protein
VFLFRKDKENAAYYRALTIIWAGKYFQIGDEAVIPVNSGTGGDVGFIAQLHFYLDDLFPPSIGRPLLEKK